MTISVLFERDIDGESDPEPVGIQAAGRKTLREINDELRAAQQKRGAASRRGDRDGRVRFIPTFLLRTFIRLASRNIAMQTAVRRRRGDRRWHVRHRTAVAHAADQRNRHGRRWRDRPAHGAYRWQGVRSGSISA